MLSDKLLPIPRAALLLTFTLSAGLLAATALAQEPKKQDKDGEKVLRVCQDPNNMPMSRQDESGYENKIAALFAKNWVGSWSTPGIRSVWVLREQR